MRSRDAEKQKETSCRGSEAGGKAEFSDWLASVVERKKVELRESREHNRKGGG